MDLPEKRCASCRFWLRGHERHDDAGECHRHAPVPVETDSDKALLFVFWPATTSKDFCGEWQPRGDA